MIKEIDESPLAAYRVPFTWSTEHIRAILDTVREPFLVLDQTLRVRLVNESFCRTFHLTPEKAQDSDLNTLGDGAWRSAELRKWVSDLFVSSSKPRDFEVEHVDPEIGQRTLRLNARRVLIAGPSQRIILVTVEDKTRKKQAEEATLKLNQSLGNTSMTDDLTGLYNRRGFEVFSQHYLQLAQRKGKRVFVIFVDVDRQKEVDDQAGRSKGDETLVRTAEILQKTFRKSDIIARIGGEEFAIIALANGGETAATQISRLQRDLARSSAYTHDHEPFSIRAGIAQSELGTVCTMEQLTAKADARMYLEKRTKPGRSLRGDNEIPGTVPTRKL